MEPDTDQLWERGKEAINTAATESLGTSRRKAKKPWVSNRSLDLMDMRRSLKSRRHQSDQEREEYQECTAELQKQLREDKQNWIEEKYDHRERGLERNDTREAYRTL